MVSVTKLIDTVYKFTGIDSVNCYLLVEEKMMIDTGNPEDREELSLEISKLIDIEDIKTVILTHMHYDHAGNVKLFPNAEVLASPQEIAALKKDAMGTVFDSRIIEELADAGMNPLPKRLKGIEIIKTPGHTGGSVCLVYKNKVLFTGDTKFGEGMYGRTDLPTSKPEQLDSSIKLLDKYKDLVFAPGHDYG